MGSQVYVNGVTLSDAAEADRWDSAGYAVLSSVSGTNTITATGAANYTLLATNVPVWFIPANTNTGATTLNITPTGATALGAKNVFFDGRACVGGEIVQNVPCGVIYDGTQFNLLTPAQIDRLTEDTAPDQTADYLMSYDASASGFKKILLRRINGVLGTPVASTSGTAITFTGIPSGVKRISVNFNEVSTNGTSQIMIQIGSGSVDTSGYVSTAASVVNAGATATSSGTSGFLIVGALTAASVVSGTAILTLESSSGNSWICSGTNKGGTTIASLCGGSKSLSGALDRVSITTFGGTDTFDAGEINIMYE